MKKKLLSLLMVVCLLTVGLLTACSTQEPAASSEEPAASSETASGEASEAASEEPAASASAAGESASSGSGDPIKVGWACGYVQTNHWELEIAGSQHAANENGVEMIVTFADGDEAKQVDDCENMAEMGIDYLITCPINDQGFVPTVESLNEKGILVGTSDSTVTGADITCHVTSDNYQIGQVAAEYLGEELGGKGQVAICAWDVATATTDRKQGFLDTLVEKYPDIEVVDSQDTLGDRTKALQFSENVLQASPDLDAIYGVNAEAALGALAATRAMDREDVIVVAVDTDTEVMDEIRSGSNLRASVSQDPFQMGYKAMENAIKVMNGEEVEELTLIPVTLITQENVDEIVQRDQDYLALVQ